MQQENFIGYFGQSICLPNDEVSEPTPQPAND
jgi:hypothetical protein